MLRVRGNHNKERQRMMKGTNGLEWLADRLQSVATAVPRRFENRGVSGGEVIAAVTKPQTRSIVVQTEPFAKDSFFGESGPAELCIWDNFRTQVLSAVSETVPAFRGTLTRTELEEHMGDSEIFANGTSRPLLSPDDFVAVVRDLISRQPRGERGILLTNGDANIFHVQPEDGPVVAVRGRWRVGLGGWSLRAYGRDDVRWLKGHCVFSRG